MADLDAANILELIDFDAYEDKELLRLSLELEKKIGMIELENSMFDSYMIRVVPTGREEEGLAAQDQDPMKLDGTGVNGGVSKERREKKKKGEKVKEMDRPVLLTFEQKSDIAARELEELRDKIQRDKEDWGKIIDNYKVNTGCLNICNCWSIRC